MSPEEREHRRKRIRAAYAESGSIREVRRKTGFSIGSIRRVLRGEDLLPRVRHAGPRPSKLDPFKPLVQRLIVEDRLTATLALEELRAVGYGGGYSVLKRYARTLRPATAPRVTTRLEHPPGEWGQGDWSPYSVLLGGESTVVHGFGYVLPFSRWMFLRFALDQKEGTLIALHEELWSELGAVPHRSSYDNMTTVGRHIGPDKVWLNPVFEAYARKYDFEIFLIDQGCPNQHPHVERNFHYVENNCLRRRRSRFEDLADLNQHAKWWCDEVANVRNHGTTRERPVDRLVRERPFLKPLPGERPEPCRTLGRKVGDDFCIAVDVNRYSVSPRWVGWPATVKAYADRLEMYVDGQLAAVHVVCRGRHQRIVLAEHEAEFRKSTSSTRLLEQAFARLGPEAKGYFDGLRAQRGRGAGYHMKRILNLADRHGATVVASAMAHAARFGNYDAEAVARVIAGKALRAGPKAKGDVPLPPERVQLWLAGLEVEERNLGDYDAMVDQGDQEVDDASSD
jgi:transposase